MRARRGSARLFVVTVAVAVPMVVASGCGDSGKPADGPVSLIDSTNSSPGPVPVPGYSVPGVVPAHGMAYRTVSGTVVATLAGEVLFTIPGVHVIDRSRDSATMAAVVAFDTDTGNPPQGYELDIGAVMMRTIGPAMDVSPYAAGWVAEGAPNGCMRDARRAGSPLLLCSPDGMGPTELARLVDGDSAQVIPLSPVQPEGIWVDAVAGPEGLVAATWSGECESLSAYLITPDNRTIPLLEGGSSAVQGWTDAGVLVSRFAGCDGDDSEAGLYLVTTAGVASLIPTPGAIETPVVW